MEQITHTLPASAWQGIEIKECGEKLVSMSNMSGLKVGGIKKSYSTSFLVRQEVRQKLIEATRYLPSGLTIVLIEGHRTMEAQKMAWNERWQIFKNSNPEWDDARLDLETRKLTARPHELANHHCGGAVDVTLMDRDGKFLDMGSPYISEGNIDEWRTKFPMFSAEITPEQARNRAILRHVMVSAGFVWYPGEWWHYCFGDRMWAVYTSRKKCKYGSIEPKK